MIHSLQKKWIPIWSGLLESQHSPNFNFYFFPFFLLLLYRGFFCKVILLSYQVNAASKISLASYLSSYKKKCNYLLNNQVNILLYICCMSISFQTNEYMHLYDSSSYLAVLFKFALLFLHQMHVLPFVCQT